MIRTNDPEYDNPPFAPDPTCDACGKPWPQHPGITKVCNANQNLITVMKAVAINVFEMHQNLVKVIDAYENPPQSPNVEKQQDFPLQDDQES